MYAPFYAYRSLRAPSRLCDAVLPPKVSRALRHIALTAGALALALVWWAYKLAVTVGSQAGFLRTLALFEVLALGVIALAALLATVTSRLPGRALRLAVVGLYAVTVFNVALTGLSIFFLTPRYAPHGVLVLGAIGAVALFVRFARYDVKTQWMVGRVLGHVGFAGLVALFLPLPWVIADFRADQPHLPMSPLPDPDLKVRENRPRLIVLVSFDALRARTTSLVDAKLNATPHLAAFAREATTFTNARAASDNTLVSLPTVLTGVRPNDYFPHIGNNAIYLREGFLVGLGGYLAGAGYQSYYATMLVNPLIFGLDGEFSAGHMTSGMFRRNQFNTRQYLPLGAALGWTQEKFAGHWDDNVDNTQNELPATREAFSEGLGYLKAAKGRAFLWIHVAVPHTPYYDVPAAQAEAPGDPARYERVTERDVAAADASTLKHYEHVYEDYARVGDAELGHFLAGMRQAKLYDQALIVVTSDHGEEFGLPGHIPHGNGIATEDVSHVPLVIHAPNQHDARKVDVLVGHRDIVPTVLSRVFERLPSGLLGSPLLDGHLQSDRFVYTWAMSSKYIPALKQAQTIAAFNGDYKLLVRYPTHEESLYNLRTDPEADTNVASRFPEVLARMRAGLTADMRRL
jgi:arylsulfatase A-like enzyme